MSLLNISTFATQAHAIVTLGSHPGIIQSILDFDYLSDNPASIKAIIGSGKNYERFFWGESEMLVPVFPTIEDLPDALRESTTGVINLLSGRRVLYSSLLALEQLPHVSVLAIFAEGVPEQHALSLRKECDRRNIIAMGPATVGLLIPGILKFGAIGGVDHNQITNNNLHTRGSLAVMSSSGGMTNELITIAANSGFGVSFGVSFGGERFPLLKPVEAMLAAEADPATKAIAYFGELGGTDEYDLADALNTGRITKPVVAYIAGTVAELFDEPPQFGHAKAMARSHDETASAKKAALIQAGAIVPNSFSDFVKEISRLKHIPKVRPQGDSKVIGPRSKSLFISSITRTDDQGELYLVGKTLEEVAASDYGSVVASLLLGHQPRSAHTAELIQLVLKLLVDHGPHVSGALNTMIAASANRDLVSALSAGLLTIGPRFGGAVNQAAATLLRGVTESMPAVELVESMAAQKQLIAGIGHKKYNIGLPDPRVKLLVASLPDGMDGVYLRYAREIEAITTQKGSSLILNVDGAIAACMLDVLAEHEGYTPQQLRKLTDIEFFNAFFVAARTVGFLGHYLDQRRLDQGLFRLQNNLLNSVELPDMY